MNSSRLSVIVCMGLILLARPAPAQTPAPKTQTPPDSAARNVVVAKKEEDDYVRQGRLEQARWLLFGLSSDVRDFRDHVLRARSLARIADALWDVAEEQGRKLFREAWEAAAVADQESQQPLDLRGGVLRLAAKRDHLLAEEFLQKLKTEQAESSTGSSGNSQSSGDNLWSLPEALEKRLGLAERLLRAGDMDSALRFADPVLGSVTVSTVEFLTLLREKSPAAADQRYAAMLAQTGGNLLADANTISILSSYIFTPHTYVIFHADGSPEFSSMPRTPPAEVSPQLRMAFFRAAAKVLLRPQPSAERGQSAASVAGKYMVLRRLMPLFEQHAPREIADVMRGQFQTLNTLVSEGVRQSQNEWIQRGITPEKQILADEGQSLLDQIERAKTADERDKLYFRLALLARDRDDLKARDHVDKIEDGEFRKQARAWVDWGLAVSAVKQKKVETALELARSQELTRIQRVWVYTRAAKLLAETDRDKALSLLDDAASEARRIENADPDRTHGLLAVANALILIEPPRAWDAVSEAVKAASPAENFTGDDGRLILSVSHKGQILRKQFEDVPDFGVRGIFSKLASDNYEWAVQLARGFQGHAPRVNATLAVALAVLNEKGVPARPSRPSAKN
jgi:hypothetical protein